MIYYNLKITTLKTIEVKDIKQFAQDHLPSQGKTEDSNLGPAFSTIKTSQLTNHRLYLHFTTSFLSLLRLLCEGFLSGLFVSNYESYT